ncbi:hypothetical protein EUTSA_v10011138mg [Eutrema salsugineum]|uniref:Serpin domain-containing protein n=1 Tax=Eutrema salsugineum TaxID=72664 RepID=V4L5E2_EUTSA|nr:serpin-Z10 [Eutrema salsugineum]ESQ45535.1 hypothetical protein EUTSA_v10011138mg [Eutrema salsugineum]
MEKSIEMQNDVVVMLARHVIATVANGSNLVFSPTSINVLLCLIAAGSNCIAKEGILPFLMLPSSDHLNAVLAKTVSVTHSNGSKRSNVRFSAAYGVWIDKSVSFKPSYEDLLDNSYNATCTQADFAFKPGEVIDDVNTWAKYQTNGVIEQILSPDSTEAIRESKLILANAMYFKGAWSNNFDAWLTKDYYFHLLDGSSVKVPYMTNDEDQYLEEYSGFQVLRLPYLEDQRQFSMYIYLPNDKDGLPALLEKIGSKPGFLDYHIPRHRVPVRAFRIPKFKFSFEFDAAYVLKNMGLTSPFNTTGGSTLTEMVDSPSMAEDLYISRIIHKASIEVDEEGTEAAAVSASMILTSCSAYESRKPDFVADHPFLFTVREDKSGLILFMGQVLDPSRH